jgi:exosortase/archaeosortase family protein
MSMKQTHKTLILRLCIFVLVLTAVSLIINSYLKTTIIYQSLIIPGIFKPIFTGMIAKVMLIIFLGFVLLNWKRFVHLKIRKINPKEVVLFSIGVILSMFFYYLVRFFVHNHLEFSTKYIWFFIPLLYIFIFTYGFSLFLAVFGYQFLVNIYKNFKKQIIPFGLAAILLYLLLIFMQSLWPYFSGGVAGILYYLFGLFYDNVSLVSNPAGPLLSVNSFAATIGAPCSGIDSFLMFAGLYALIFLLDYRKLNKPRAILAFFIGLIGTYCFNILRIFLLFLTGIYISPQFAVGLFHQNIGWILFILYFGLFWWIASRYVYRA